MTDNNEILAQLNSEIKDADMFLIGMGNELAGAGKKQVESSAFYQTYKDRVTEDSKSIFEYLSNYQYAANHEKIKQIYQKLIGFLDKKNYFIFSSNTDQLLQESQLNQIRIVSPCGCVSRLQCECEGEDAFCDATPFYEQMIKALENSSNEKKINLVEMLPVCKECGQRMFPNVYKEDNYNENGYLKQWNLYNKWLQRTLNKKLIILELGEGFKMPTLMRWPFEKIVFINEKARLYRINKDFYQVPENLHEKGFAVKSDSKDFLETLLNENR